jgi:hypothetical protein
VSYADIIAITLQRINPAATTLELDFHSPSSPSLQQHGLISYPTKHLGIQDALPPHRPHWQAREGSTLAPNKVEARIAVKRIGANAISTRREREVRRPTSERREWCGSRVQREGKQRLCLER